VVQLTRHSSAGVGDDVRTRIGQRVKSRMRTRWSTGSRRRCVVLVEMIALACSTQPLGGSGPFRFSVRRRLIDVPERMSSRVCADRPRWNRWGTVSPVCKFRHCVEDSRAPTEPLQNRCTEVITTTYLPVFDFYENKFERQLTKCVRGTASDRISPSPSPWVVG